MRKALIIILLLLAGVVAASPTQTARPETISLEAPVQTKDQVATLSLLVATNTQEKPREKEETSKSFYLVTKVIDGDTLVVTKDGVTTTLRLIGLDTPETVDPRKEVQCFGNEASSKAKELLINTSVRIETDPSQGTLDKYGRTLAYLYLRDGTLFNKFMIENGFGHEYTYQVPYKFRKEFREAEAVAKEKKRGLWNEAACKATTPEPKPATETKAPISTPTPTNTGSYICSKNTYNCSDFKTHSEAQAAFVACGGASNDIHKLDRDGDGTVCESLP